RVGVAGEPPHGGGLPVLSAALEIAGAAPAAAPLVARAAGDDRLRHRRDPAGRQRLGNRAHGGRVLGVDVAAAAVAEAVVEAARAIVVVLRIDRGRAGERVPAELARGRRHALGEFAAGERRHGILACARSFKMLPRLSIVPLTLPAWPEMPTSYSTLS